MQDSVTLAIDLELRYRGLRAPHKLKAAVSGCTRECAEAQGKDFGVIATEKGWNVYVCGNGGMRPQHAVLLAADLDRETVIRYIDRFLMFYIRTADRLERTAMWFNKLDGGIDHLRRVVIDDALGIGAELEAEMERHVADLRVRVEGHHRRPRAGAALPHVRELRRGRPQRRVRHRAGPAPARPAATRSRIPALLAAGGR